MREDLNKSDFEPLIMQMFEVRPRGFQPTKIQLAEIQDRSTDYMESFSLLFRGEKNACVINSDTHLISHPDMGEFLLFLGPVDIKKQDAVYYEAVFNRLR